MSDGSIDTPGPDAPGSEPPQLSQRHQAFADGYLISGNATQAALDAGYNSSGNRRAAHVTGYQLLRLPNVAAYIASRRGELQAHRDSAVAAAYAVAPAAVARLEDLAAKDMDDATAAELGQIRQANETLLTIGEVIPRGGVAVDARSLTVNMGGHDPRLAGISVDELTIMINELRARQAAGSEALEGPAGVGD